MSVYISLQAAMMSVPKAQINLAHPVPHGSCWHGEEVSSTHVLCRLIQEIRGERGAVTK